MLVFAGGAGANEAEKSETFTSADFLEWRYEDQKLYFRIAVGMTGLIARQNNVAQSECLESWYFEDEEKAVAEILEIMWRFENYHPRGVILAVLEKNCGDMIFK